MEEKKGVVVRVSENRSRSRRFFLHDVKRADSWIIIPASLERDHLDEEIRKYQESLTEVWRLKLYLSIRA